MLWTAAISRGRRRYVEKGEENWRVGGCEVMGAGNYGYRGVVCSQN